MRLTKSDLLSRLQTEFGYTAEEAALIVGDLQQCGATIQSAFEQWWKEGNEPESLAILGFTIKRLMDNYGMNPVAAFLTLDWLENEPTEALESLKEGYDRVEVG